MLSTVRFEALVVTGIVRLMHLKPRNLIRLRRTLLDIKPDQPGLDDPGRGRRLGLDIGTVRIGAAYSDRDGMLANPLETIRRTTDLQGPDGDDIDRILELIAEHDVVEVVVGLPRNLDGSGSKSVTQAVEFATRIQRRLEESGKPTPVRFCDERLTTVIANQVMRDTGLSQKKGRKVVDQIAAVSILQQWLDGRKKYFARQELGGQE